MYETYVENRMSLNHITRELKLKSSNSARQALLKLGIKVRTTSEGLRTNNEIITIDEEIVNGSLLGDAGLKKYNRLSENSFPYFYKKNKYYDHVCLIAESFYPSSYKERVKIDINKINDKEFEYYLFRTSVDEVFKKYYDEWYPSENNFKKKVPTSLKLTPKTILHWFMDDGSSYRRIREGKRTNQIIICFSSESFSENDNLFLSEELNKYSLKSSIHKVSTGYGWRIGIPQSKNIDFLDLIGECPITSMNYKWKRDL